MRYLITGGCGFIGSNFINFVHENDKDAFVVNIDKLIYSSNVNSIKNKDCLKYKFIHESICNYLVILNILNEYQITHIVHFAAQTHVDISFIESLEYTQDNVYGTHCLLEASRIYNKLSLFLHFSTDEVYGESLHNHKFDERSFLCPTNPYSATKAAAEMLVNSYIYSYKLPVIITRCNNVYGPNQYADKIIPKFIQLLDDGKDLTIQGDGSSIRSFIHVEDVCLALNLIINKQDTYEIYNIGCWDEMTVLEVATLICTYYKRGQYFDKLIKLKFIPDRPFNDKRYFISNEKLQSLGWTPKITLVQYIRQLE